MVDKGVWVCMSRKIIDKMFLIKYLDYQDTDATKEINKLPPQNSFASVII